MSEVEIPPVRSVFIKTAAEQLGVCRRTVYHYIRDGRLQTVQAGKSQRVLKESLETLLRLRRGGE